MTSLLGMHWIRTHPDSRDLEHIARMQYPSVKAFEWHWSDRNACRELLAVLPTDAYILARDHPLSEQPIWGDPVGTGTRHADEWADKVRSGRYHLPTDRSFFLGRNEPDATTGDRNAIDLYTASFLDRLREHGLRGGAFNFSTGHPRTVDGTGNTPADYSVFERSHQSIVAGHHIGVLHIYGTAAQPCVPGHYDRLKACTWQDVEWVVGEMGADEHVIGGGAHDGYLESMKDNPARYCAWLDALIMGIGDSRIHSYQVFTHDFSHPWASFDIRPIRDALETYDWQHTAQPPTKPDAPPHTVHLPAVSSGKPTPNYVIAPAGANIRSQPNVQSEVVWSVPFGDEVEAMGATVNALGEMWTFVRYKGMSGHIRRDLLGKYAPAQPSEPTPPAPPVHEVPTPTGIIDPRVAQAILQIESGGRTHGLDGRPIIRFESHIFEGKAGDSEHFRYDPQTPWAKQEWRRSASEAWRPIHTGSQASEYAAFEFAKSINRDAAHQSISMGAPQIMGFNHARIGYPSAEAMFESFQSAPMQTIGFINFFLSDPALIDAMRRKDFRTIAAKYNGSGQADYYAGLLEKAYQEASR